MSLPSVLQPSQRRIHLWTREGADRVLVTEAKGTEELSRPYRFSLQLRSDAVAPLDLKAWLGSPVRLAFQLPDPDWTSALAAGELPATRDFCGILSTIEFRASDEQYGYYLAILRPRLWRFKLNRRFRVFGQLTTRQIVDEVLGDLPVRWEISDGATPRNYCVQYRESDLAFVQRLLAEDGYFYFFEHRYEGQADDPAERSERLVITDSIDRVATDDPPTFPFDAIRGGNRSSQRIRRWRSKLLVSPTTVDAIDRHFQRPQSVAVGNRTCTDMQPETARTVTIYPSRVVRRIDEVAPSGDSDPGRLQPLDSLAESDARRRAEQFSVRQSEHRGSGDTASMTPAMKFRFAGHSPAFDGVYYLTRVDHLIRLASNRRSGPDSQELLYRNQFRCQEETKPFRPPTPAKNVRIPGVVSATVVADPAVTEDEVCVDRYGRVKVQFPWQNADDSSGCWIRVSQIWAGPRWGAFFWPRVGHEVLVAFEHGDPERPVVVGSVYNALNLPPLTLPDHKLSCGIHSCTHRGNPIVNTNCVVFHDANGDEYLQLHSETYQSVTCESQSFFRTPSEEVATKGHHFLFDGFGSGGGGSDATGNNENASVDGMKKEGEGEFEWGLLLDLITGHGAESTYVVGDAYKKAFGKNIETFFGCNVWLGCDPVELFEWIAGKMPGGMIGKAIGGTIVAGLLGAGGQGKTTLGGSHNLQYGTKVDILRGHSLTGQLHPVKWPFSKYGKGNSTPPTVLVAQIAQLLFIMCLITDLVMMILVRQHLSSNESKWKRTVKGGKIWTVNVLPRVQGLIEFSETFPLEVEHAFKTAKDSLKNAQDAAGEAIRVLTDTDSSQWLSVQAAIAEVWRTQDALRNATKKVEQLTETMKWWEGE